MSQTTMVRVPIDIIEKFRENHPELKGLSYTAIVEVMLRRVLEKETAQIERGNKK